MCLNKIEKSKSPLLDVVNDLTKLVRVQLNLRFDEVQWFTLIELKSLNRRTKSVPKCNVTNHFLIINAWFSTWYLLLFVSIDRNVGRSQIFAHFWHYSKIWWVILRIFLDLIRLLLYFWWIFKSRKDGEKDMSFPILRVSFAFMRFLRLSYEPRPNMEPSRGGTFLSSQHILHTVVG